MKRRPCSCYQTNPLGVELFSHVNVPINLDRSWPHKRKRSIRCWFLESDNVLFRYKYNSSYSRLKLSFTETHPNAVLRVHFFFNVISLFAAGIVS